MKTLNQIGIKEIKYSTRREQNIEKHGDNANSCVVCGRPTNEEYFINTVEGPDFIKADVTDADLKNHNLFSQGLFPIGPVCAKKLPKGYVVKSN